MTLATALQIAQLTQMVLQLVAGGKTLPEILEDVNEKFGDINDHFKEVVVSIYNAIHHEDDTNKE